jgi:hypothetical protein
LDFWHALSHSWEKGQKDVNTKVTMVYWKSKKFWLGKLLEHPAIMTQGRTLNELEKNIRDAYRIIVLDDVPEKHQYKEVIM